MSEVLVASVVMPERGVFQVRCPDEVRPEDCTAGRRVIVALDYGADAGEIASVGAYDPAVHGPRIPGYRLERFVEDADAARFTENAALAEKMRDAFEKAAKGEAPDVRVLAGRLSFGRTRLFLRFVSEKRRPDLSGASAEMKRLFGVSVNAWQMGPRDEVACVGALGPCGRVCCCASWQKRFPARISAPEGANQACVNGMCGRFKCCWSFE